MKKLTRAERMAAAEQALMKRAKRYPTHVVASREPAPTSEWSVVIKPSKSFGIDERHALERALSRAGFEVTGGGTDLMTGQFDVSFLANDASAAMQVIRRHAPGGVLKHLGGLNHLSTHGVPMHDRFYELTEADGLHKDTSPGLGTALAALAGLGLLGGAAYLALGSSTAKKNSSMLSKLPPAAAGRSALTAPSPGRAPAVPGTASSRTAAAPRVPSGGGTSDADTAPLPTASAVAGATGGDTSQWSSPSASPGTTTDADTTPPSPNILGPALTGGVLSVAGPAAGLIGGAAGTVASAIIGLTEGGASKVPDPVSAVENGVSNLLGNSGGTDADNS